MLRGHICRVTSQRVQRIRYGVGSAALNCIFRSYTFFFFIFGSCNCANRSKPSLRRQRILNLTSLCNTVFSVSNMASALKLQLKSDRVDWKTVTEVSTERGTRRVRGLLPCQQPGSKDEVLFCVMEQKSTKDLKE